MIRDSLMLTKVKLKITTPIIGIIRKSKVSSKNGMQMK
jgi:hypothetical protein